MAQKDTPNVRRLEELSSKEIAWGEKLISEEKVGCLIMAGGQGTRLGFDGPKGLFPINEKTLFDIHLSKQRGPISVMTSPENDRATRKALPPLDFFIQEEFPFLDDDKKPLSIKGPSGNGGLLRHFTKSGLWQKWWDLGIRYLNIIPVDNRLADPFDSSLLGYLAQNNHDIVVKAIDRPDGQVGVLVFEEERLRVVEYSENPPDSAYANISCFALTMEFAHQTEHLPIHLAHKKINDRWAWKQEEFIFDILPKAKHPGILVYPKEKCFAPLKTPEDVQSLSNH